MWVDVPYPPDHSSGVMFGFWRLPQECHHTRPQIWCVYFTYAVVMKGQHQCLFHIHSIHIRKSNHIHSSYIPIYIYIHYPIAAKWLFPSFTTFSYRLHEVCVGMSAHFFGPSSLCSTYRWHYKGWYIVGSIEDLFWGQAHTRIHWKHHWNTRKQTKSLIKWW